jgi:XTP/dITP diphosphohydrolase
MELEVKRKQEKLDAFARLLSVMEDLRAGCPWDQKQTWESLRHLTIEEVYELGDAILDSDHEEVKKEIGDIFLHLVFYAKIGEEKGCFDVADVLHSICEKLIFRHPHIYGDVSVKDEDEVKANWEKLKLKEGKKSVLEGVPKSLPAMVKAQRIQEKARGVGFDWDNESQVWEKVVEEMNEFKLACDELDEKEQMAELGDVLFSVINYARFKNLNPEEALERTNKKFISRFQYLEECINRDGKNWEKMNLSEMDVYWDEAKKLGL